MAESLMNTPEVRRLLDKVAGSDSHAGDEGLRKIVHRVASDICRIVEEFDVTPTDFWSAVSYLTRLGQANEVGLLVPGLGIEHFLDLMTDEGRRAGLQGRTPQTIEGPLIATRRSRTARRVDRDPEQGGCCSWKAGSKGGRMIAGAIVDVWHANAKGGYSRFDPSRARHSLRRRIAADAEGATLRSAARGLALPPDGPTPSGRAEPAPAHIHFFVGRQAT
jgi:catechol 1,2-dioxygenase